MTFTVTQYQALCAAIGSGELRVRYDGKEVEFRSIAELMKAKTLVEDYLVAAGLISAPTVGGVVRGGTTYAAYSGE